VVKEERTGSPGHPSGRAGKRHALSSRPSRFPVETTLRVYEAPPPNGGRPAIGTPPLPPKGKGAAQKRELRELIEHDAFSLFRFALFIIPALWKDDPRHSTLTFGLRRCAALAIAASACVVVFGETRIHFIEPFAGFLKGEQAEDPKPSAKDGKGIATPQKMADSSHGPETPSYAWNSEGSSANNWNPNDPITIEFHGSIGIKLTALKVCKDAQAMSDGKYKLKVENGLISILPSRGYWTIGRQDIRIDLNVDNMPVTTHTTVFVSQEVSTAIGQIKPFIKLGDSIYCSHGVGPDHGTNSIYITPSGDVIHKPSYLSILPFVDRIRPYSFGVEFMFSAWNSGCFQVALPGGISVQIGEGNRNIATVKVGYSYIAGENGELTPRRSEALEIPLSDLILTRNSWLYFSYDTTSLTLSTGAKGSDVIKSVSISKSDLNPHKLSACLRSYGPDLLISQFHFGECNPDRPAVL